MGGPFISTGVCHPPAAAYNHSDPQSCSINLTQAVLLAWTTTYTMLKYMHNKGLYLAQIYRAERRDGPVLGIYLHHARGAHGVR